MNDSPAVFRISAALILVFVILGAAYPVAMGTVFNHLQDWIVETIGWYYILAVAFFLAGTASGSAMATLGIGLIGLVFMLIVLWSGVRAVWNALNRLFTAMGQATGGVVMAPGMAAAATASAGACFESRSSAPASRSPAPASRSPAPASRSPAPASG